MVKHRLNGRCSPIETQFEKAQKEGERFSIFVEFVGDEKELSGKSKPVNIRAQIWVNLRFPITKLLQRSAGTFLLMVKIEKFKGRPLQVWKIHSTPKMTIELGDDE